MSNHPGRPTPKLSPKERAAATKAIIKATENDAAIKANNYYLQAKKYDAMVAGVEYLRSKCKTPYGSSGSNKSVDFSDLKYLSEHSLFMGKAYDGIGTAGFAAGHLDGKFYVNDQWNNPDKYPYPLKPDLYGSYQTFGGIHIVWNATNLIEAWGAFSKKAEKAWENYHKYYNKSGAASILAKQKGNGGGGGSTAAKYVTKGDLDALPAVYNVGAVNQAYFRQNNVIQGTGGNTYGGRATAYEGRELVTTYGMDKSGGLGLNSPTYVTDALELWQTSMTNKGMLQTYFPPEGWSTNGDATTAFPAEITLHKYGFQFMFNPNSVNMTYQSTAQVDPAYEMAGKDKFNYLPAVGSGGTVSFSLMVNRMFDLQYYDTTGHIASEYKGKNLYPVREPYGPEGELYHKLFDEQKMIYEGGTMYDIEYLLRTLMGFTLKTELRHNIINSTADMGIYNLRPVELHLGPAMRYRGRVVSLSINHVIFNERMVPMLSTVNIGFQRYPDYPFKKNSSSNTAGAKEKFTPGA
jgi:hypothetical protein